MHEARYPGTEKTVGSLQKKHLEATNLTVMPFAPPTHFSDAFLGKVHEPGKSAVSIGDVSWIAPEWARRC